MQNDREEQLRQRAYRKWEEEGRPEGRHLNHWAEAERSHDESGAAETEDAPDPGIGQSKGLAGGSVEEIAGESTVEGDVLNDTTPSGGVDPNQRGRTNK